MQENNIEPVISRSSRRALSQSSNRKMGNAETKPGQIPASSSSTAPSVLQAGDRCRVNYDSGSDFTGVQRPGAGGWFEATVYANHGAKIDIRFDGQTTPESVDCSDVQRLMEGTSDEDRHLVYAETAAGLEVYYDTTPLNLKLGDLVYGRFQNNPDAWFRGRVVNSGKTTDDHPHCTIFYDDGDYEMEIPYSQPNTVRLLQRSAEHPDWLLGLDINIPSSPKKKDTGKIVGVTKNTEGQAHQVQVEYQGPSGAFTKVRPYRTVLQKLIQDKLPLTKVAWPILPTIMSLKNWLPETEPSAKPRKAPERKSQAKKPRRTSPTEKACASRAPLSSHKKPSRSIRPSRNAVSYAEDESEDDFMPPDESLPLKKPPRPPRLAKQALKAPPPANASRAKAAIPMETDSEEALPEREPLYKPAPLDIERESSDEILTEINFSQKECYLRSIKSSAPENGFCFLELLLSTHQQIPDKSLWNELFEMVMYGPKSGRNVYYPDSARMDMLMGYLRKLLRHRGMRSRYIAFVEEEYASSRARQGTTYWEDALKRSTLEYYKAPGDETRQNASAIHRIAPSVHAKACCIELFADLLEFQAQNCLQTRGRADVDFCQEQSILGSILDHSRGPKYALELSVEVCIQQWIEYGHFMYGDSQSILQAGNAANISFLYSIHAQAKRLLGKLGKIISYMAWLYEIKAHENTLSVARVIGNVVMRELGQCEFDPAPFLGQHDPTAYWKDIKYHFVMNLDRFVVPQLRPLVATQIGIGSKYNAVHGVLEQLMNL